MFDMINRAIIEVQTRKDAALVRQEGQGLVEYALIGALVSVACIVALGALATAINGKLGVITAAL